MYSNIGKKVCGIAKFCGVIGMIGIIAGVICFIVGIMEDDTLMIAGISVIVSGFACYIGSWPLYAFGQITTDVHEMKEKLVD